MAGSPPSSYPGFPSLSPDQQKLLLAALTSNNQSGRQLNMEQFRGVSASGNQLLQGSALGDESNGSVDPSVLDSFRRDGLAAPPSLNAPPTFGGGLLPDVINDNEFNVDVNLPGSTDDADDGFPFESPIDGEFGEKRKSPEDDSDEDDEDGSSKRRESDDKGPKKPGRKPLTSEPTTKRKAQNRAAQRAFRERKEKHLKDLEQKVADLEKASQTANHENDVLKAQISRLQAEVHDYRKRLSDAGTALNGSPPPANDPSSAFRRNTNRNSSSPFEFPFEFPVFGSFPSNGTSLGDSESSTLFDPNNSIKQESSSRSNSNATTPRKNGGFTGNSASPPSMASNSPSGPNGNYNMSSENFSPGFGNLNEPSMSFSSMRSPSNYANGGNQNSQAPARNGSKFPSTSDSSNCDSPSNSSVSHHGPGSSTATSPEPVQNTNGDSSSTQNHKSNTNGNILETFASYQNPGAQDFGLDLSSFQFDPNLFGTYRETQEAIYGDGDFTGGLYDDYLNLNDLDGLNANPNFPRKTTPVPPPQPLQLEKTQSETQVFNVDNNETIEIPKKLEDQNMMTCHTMWEQLSTCPKFKEGELDIDSLCSELSKKATCSERGAVIPKAEWEAALWRLVGQEKPAGSPATASPSTAK